MTEWILWPKLSENMGFMRSPGCNNSRMLKERKHIYSYDDGERVLPGIFFIPLETVDWATWFPKISIFPKSVHIKFLPLCQVSQFHGINLILMIPIGLYCF